MSAPDPVNQGRLVVPRKSTKPPGPAMRGFGTTMRVDRWSIRPGLVALGLTVFILYATASAIFGIPYFGVDYEAAGYHSPFFGIALGENVLPAWFSPAILVLWIQAFFRATCYYFRGAYYKAFFADPLPEDDEDGTQDDDYGSDGDADGFVAEDGCSDDSVLDGLDLDSLNPARPGRGARGHGAG